MWMSSSVRAPLVCELLGCNVFPGLTRTSYIVLNCVVGATSPRSVVHSSGVMRKNLSLHHSYNCRQGVGGEHSRE